MSQVSNGSGEADVDVIEFLPWWAVKVKIHYTRLPTPVAMIFMTVQCYLLQIMNLYLALGAYQAGNMTSFYMLVGGIIAPGIVGGACALPHRFLGDSTKHDAIRVSILYFLNLEKVYFSWNYLKHKVAPPWKLIGGDFAVAAAVGNLPTLATNLVTLASGTVPAGSKMLLILSTAFALLLAPSSPTRFFHISTEPPANFGNYRLLDFTAPDALEQIQYMLILDWSAMYYRMGLFALVYAAQGPWPLLALMYFSALVRAIFLFDSFGKLPVRLLVSVPVSLMCGIVYCLYDLVFEPNAAHYTNMKHAYWLRAIEAQIATAMILWNSGALLDKPETSWIWSMVAFTIFFMVAYFWLTPVALYGNGVFAQRRREKAEKVEDFFEMLRVKRKKAEEEAAKRDKDAEKQGQGQGWGQGQGQGEAQGQDARMKEEEAKKNGETTAVEV